MAEPLVAEAVGQNSTQYQGLQLLSCRAALPLPSRTLSFAAGVIRRHRKPVGSCRRRLSPGQQALPVLAYLKKGETFAQAAAGPGAGAATAWRHDSETVEARAPKLRRAVRDAKRAGHAYVIVDGTLIPVGRVAAGRPFCPGKHQKHGMNLQVIASPHGDLLWVFGALPGPVHDKKAERVRGVPGELERQRLAAPAGKGCQGSTGAMMPCRGKGKPGPQKEASRAHAELRGPGERANAQLKSWKILSGLRCCPWRAGKLAKAIHVLQAREA